MRAVFAPATPYSDSIARPGCSECGTATFLVGIESERSGYALITFECPKCEHFETALWKAAQVIRSGRGPWEGNAEQLLAPMTGSDQTAPSTDKVQ